MKAMRYGQQLCELLNLMAGKDGWNRNIMARTLSAAFGDSEEPSGDGHDTFGGDEYTDMQIFDYYRLHANLIASLAANGYDTDGNGDVDGVDLAQFSHWLAQGDERADLNNDLSIDSGDIDLFSSNFSSL